MFTSRRVRRIDGFVAVVLMPIGARKTSWLAEPSSGSILQEDVKAKVAKASDKDLPFV